GMRQIFRRNHDVANWVLGPVRKDLADLRSARGGRRTDEERAIGPNGRHNIPVARGEHEHRGRDFGHRCVSSRSQGSGHKERKEREHHSLMKKSIGDNIFPQGMTFENGLKLWLGDRPWFQMQTSDAELRRLLSRIEDAGLAVSDVANSLDWKQNIAARDPALRAAAFRHIERQMEAAQSFKTDAILVVAGIVTSEIPYNEVYNRCVDSLKKLAETAAKAKVKIGVENCNSEQRFLLSAREFHTFLNDVNSPWVGNHLDVGNIHDTGFAEQWIEIQGPRITRIHVKDVLKHRGRCGNQSV